MNTTSIDITKASSTDTNTGQNEDFKVEEKKIFTNWGWISPSQLRVFRASGLGIKKLNLKNKNVFQLQKLARRHPLIAEDIQKEYMSRSCKKITIKIPTNKVK